MTDFIMVRLFGNVHSPYADNQLINGKTGKDAILNYFNEDNINVKVSKGKGLDVNVKLIPVIIKDGEKHQHPTKICVWYKVELI